EAAAFTGEAIELAGVLGLAVAPLVAVLEGLIEIGEAHEAGKTDGQRHCFRTGFAQELIHENWNPTMGSIALTSTDRYYQQKGKEAAIILKRCTSPEALDSFRKYLAISPVTKQADVSSVARLLKLMGDAGGLQQKPGQQQDQQQQKGQQQQQKGQQQQQQGQYTGQGM